MACGCRRSTCTFRAARRSKSSTTDGAIRGTRSRPPWIGSKRMATSKDSPVAANDKTGAARARAGANFALIKYWGKADARLNVPAVGSISITLDRLFTETAVELASGAASDELILDGKRRDEDL